MNQKEQSYNYQKGSQPDLLSPITDQSLILELIQQVENILDQPTSFNLNWINRQHWAVVPIEGASIISDNFAEELSQAMKEMGHLECLAVTIEDIGDYPKCYSFPTTKAGILEQNWVFSGFNFIFIPKDYSFCILLTCEDFYLVAGPKKFVERVIGCSISNAKEQFLSFALASELPERNYFIKVAQMYEQFNP